jgi:hypothetical protein
LLRNLLLPKGSVFTPVVARDTLLSYFNHGPLLASSLTNYNERPQRRMQGDIL